jgi:hypothetical protein
MRKQESWSSQNDLEILLDEQRGLLEYSSLLVDFVRHM